MKSLKLKNTLRLSQVVRFGTCCKYPWHCVTLDSTGQMAPPIFLSMVEEANISRCFTKLVELCHGVLVLESQSLRDSERVRTHSAKYGNAQPLWLDRETRSQPILVRKTIWEHSSVAYHTVAYTTHWSATPTTVVQNL